MTHYITNKKYRTKNQMLARRNYPNYNTLIRFRTFIKFVEVGKENECWVWKGNVVKGYGQFWWGEKEIYLAHVAAYRFFVGSIPKKHGKRLKVCHSCDTPLCVNPKHLWLGTQKDNIRDMMAKGRRHDSSGERNVNAKLTLEKVERIRKLDIKGYSSGYLARKFHIDYSQIRRIISGDIWKTVQ